MIVEECRVAFKHEYQDRVSLISLDDWDRGVRWGASNLREYDGDAEYGQIRVHRDDVSESEWRQLSEGTVVSVRLVEEQAYKWGDEMEYRFVEIVEFVELSGGTQAGLGSF